MLANANSNFLASGQRPSKDNRAVVTGRIDVVNQRDERVLSYTAKRLLAGRPDQVSESRLQGNTPEGRRAVTIT
jgi:hypothetical protein